MDLTIFILDSMLYNYQKSLKNALNEQPKFLTRKLAPITDDIFSQAPQQDSSYMYDSFVVPDEEEDVYQSIFFLN